jgi:polyhydroxyalkanoate synthase
MHGEYLRAMYLRDDLAEGRYEVGGQPVSIADIHVPFFVVGTETDHVAPWHSVYKIHLLNAGDMTFVLTSGGHNAGIISEPGHHHRHYSASRRAKGDSYVGPDAWIEQATETPGSWWPAWATWLADQSSVQDCLPPQSSAMGIASLGTAPGHYVLEH